MARTAEKVDVFLFFSDQKCGGHYGYHMASHSIIPEKFSRDIMLYWQKSCLTFAESQEIYDQQSYDKQMAKNMCNCSKIDDVSGQEAALKRPKVKRSQKSWSTSTLSILPSKINNRSTK
uniref:Uncharacterized protein n=1 Tax=Romanomermis culicivorax TaxID=13658 RepID=A0A915HH94_ROMCU